MNSNFKKIKRSTLLLILAYSSQLSPMTSTMSHRVMGTSPLLYRMMDYSKHQTCFEIEPIYSTMYDEAHINENIILNGKTSLLFDQQGTGDLNPMWLNLMSNNIFANYKSTVTFTPTLSQAGALFHVYNQFDNNVFFDIKTALVQCKTEIEINEVGGGNGLIPGVMNAQQAFNQSDWNYGKIGQSNHVVGLDNIELRFGKVAKATSDTSCYDMLIAGFVILEAPTGTGTKSEWLFEPQVGTNHWGLGFGFEALVSGDDDLKFMIAGNYRYLIPAWETRSFDLLGNGQWSRYLSVQDTYGLPTAPATLGLPGINFFTQQAYINGRSELNLYTRLQKEFKSSHFELSYNFLCVQQETIGAIKAITSGYGIYALTGPAGGPGGITTASTATINQDLPSLDPLRSPVAVTTDRFDKISACAGTYATNTLAARLEIQRKNIIYGFGASIEAALSASAISTWSVWAQFGFVFDSMPSSHCDHEFSPELYDLNLVTSESIHHTMNMDNAKLPEDVITAIHDQFIDGKDNFEFQDDEDFNYNKEINNLQKNLILNEISQLKDQIIIKEEEKNKEIEALEKIIQSNEEEKEKTTLDSIPMTSSVDNTISETNIKSIETPSATITQPAVEEIQPALQANEDKAIEPSAEKNPTPVETPPVTTAQPAAEEIKPALAANEDKAIEPSTEKNPTPVETPSVTTTQPAAEEIKPALEANEDKAIEPSTEKNPTPVETLSVTTTQPAAEEEIKPALEANEDKAIEPSAEKSPTSIATTEILESDMPTQNQTISLQDHPVIPQAEDGLDLTKDNSDDTKENLVPTLEMTPATAQTTADEDVAKLNLKKNTQSLSEKEILDKLDSKK